MVGNNISTCGINKIFADALTVHENLLEESFHCKALSKLLTTAQEEESQWHQLLEKLQQQIEETKNKTELFVVTNENLKKSNLLIELLQQSLMDKLNTQKQHSEELRANTARIYASQVQRFAEMKSQCSQYEDIQKLYLEEAQNKELEVEIELLKKKAENLVASAKEERRKDERLRQFIVNLATGCVVRKNLQEKLHMSNQNRQEQQKIAVEQQKTNAFASLLRLPTELSCSRDTSDSLHQEQPPSKKLDASAETLSKHFITKTNFQSNSSLNNQDRASESPIKSTNFLKKLLTSSLSPKNSFALPDVSSPVAADSQHSVSPIHESSKGSKEDWATAVDTRSPFSSTSTSQASNTKDIVEKTFRIDLWARCNSYAEDFTLDFASDSGIESGTEGPDALEKSNSAFMFKFEEVQSASEDFGFGF